MQWFKFYGAEYLSDPKMLSLSPVGKCCWVALLCHASMSSDGIVRHITSERLLMQVGIDPTKDEWEENIGVLETLQALQCVTLARNGDVTVSKWSARQSTFSSGAERQKKYRERLKTKTESSVTLHNALQRPLQQSDARIEENRIDTSENKFSPIVEVREDNEEKPAKRETRTKDKDAIFALFSSKKEPWWFHRQQKEAAVRLFDMRGLENVRIGVATMRENQSDQFCPQAHTPFEYEQKLPALNAYRKKNNL